jgi:hypothetical protein
VDLHHIWLELEVELRLVLIKGREKRNMDLVCVSSGFVRMVTDMETIKDVHERIWT